ncbi:MAG: hypothetical protein R3274_04010 [Desulfobacterales bacterium]|nr:hypothetical protein [Desulfobacterales bacterium]
MTKRCFSASQLYALRNEINVQVLIENTLGIPCRLSQGCFRFLCPLCHGFDTAVNPKTNLARCFRCEKNYNTIDLVMLARQADFVHSVKFLQSIHQKDDGDYDRHHPMPQSATHQQTERPTALKTRPEKSDSQPPPIGEILGSVLAPKHGGISQRRTAESKPDKPAAVHQNADEDRIVKLERQLEYLGRQIEKIARALSGGLPSK